MKKRLFALLLDLALLGSGPVLPVSAETGLDTAVQTVRALGIMTGDEAGNMNLEANVTRAQFAKLLTAASTFRDEVTPGGAGYSLYRDVKSSHWASGYIRVAAREGWMTGYTDSTFRPDNTITLEEACTAVLRMLGYDSATLAGSFPWAQLDKAAAIGLRRQLEPQQGQTLTRGDCARLFYNLLTAENAQGQKHAAVLGYTLNADGEVDYTAFLLKNLRGPFVAAGGESLPFVPQTVYRNGKAGAAPELAQNDVYYYNEGLSTVWVYTERVYGRIQAVTPEVGTPTAVTVAGKSYRVASSDVAYRLSGLAGTSVDSYVTLLLGMNDAVAGVLSGDMVRGHYYGLVQSSVPSADRDKGMAQTSLTVFCMDGLSRTFAIPQTLSLRPGTPVLVTVTADGESVQQVSSSSLTGLVSGDLTMLGGRRLSQDLRVIDGNGMGDAASIKPARLAGVYLEDGGVRYYSENDAGEIDNLILNDVTGDTWTFGYLTGLTDLSTRESINVTYTYLTGDGSKTFHSESVAYGVSSASGVAVQYDAAGAVTAMRRMESLLLDGLDGQRALSAGQARPIAENAQAYLYRNSGYYPVSLSAIDTVHYTLTGWYDPFHRADGGMLRLIVAVPVQ